MGVLSSLRSSLSVSLVLHALLVTLFWLLSQQASVTSPPSRMTWVELEPQSAPQKARVRPEQPEKIRRQLVQTERGEQVEKAAPDSFLGEKTQVVQKQTVSTRRIEDQIASQKREAQKRQVLQPRQELANLGLPILPRVQQQKKFDEPDWAEQGAGSPQDFVRGVEKGDRTALNTKEFIFFGYFQRIRERLDRAWVPILRHKLVTYHRTGRRLASDMDYTTKLLVTLNLSGEIVRVQVLSESGTSDLDAAAVNAFNQAGPFPNPPKGIIDRNGEIQIPWEFILRT